MPEGGAVAADVPVVVTRPRGQAEELCAALRGPGIEVHAVPCLEIVPEPVDAAMQERARAVRHAEWWIFTSPNAVAWGLPLLPWHDTGRDGPQLAAVGETTARALTNHGLGPVLHPGGDATSEGLLERPELARVRGKRVMIATGVGGRGEIARELRARGAEVEELAVYRRHPPAAEELQKAIERLPAAGARVLVATSAEALNAFASVASGRRWLTGATVVCPGERIAAEARELGSVPAMSGTPYARDLAETTRRVAGLAEQGERR